MLLSLPPELVTRIVRLALPTATAIDGEHIRERFTSTTYKDRQALLKRLCLVNSRMKEVVQPILEEAAWCRTDKANTDRRTLPNERDRLKFSWFTRPDRRVDGILSNSKAFLREVRLFGPGEVDLGGLAGLPHLRRLVLDNVELVVPPTHSSLPQVDRLTWRHVKLPPDCTSHPVLNPTSLPSLRAFFHIPHPSSLPLDRTLLSQLDCATYFLNVEPEGPSEDCSILTDIVTLNPLPARPYLRWTCSATRTSDDREFWLRYELHSLLSDGVPGDVLRHLKRFYLPAFGDPSRCTDQTLRPHVVSLLEIMRNSGVEVVFEDQDGDGADRISDDFWRYARERTKERRKRGR
ncbi:hypothetical protein JCM8547_006371 [Rhodosporidiobolus lusitaniae]